MSHLTRVWTDSCNGDNCPTVYTADDGSYVVQGANLDDSTSAELTNVGPDESAVRIPRRAIDFLVNERLREMGIN